MKKVALKISGMHCSSCAMNIDGELEDTKGVKEANTNYAKAQIVVTFDDTLLNENDLVKIIHKIGYDASMEK